jgi:hypothetical protein
LYLDVFTSGASIIPWWFLQRVFQRMVGEHHLNNKNKNNNEGL